MSPLDSHLVLHLGQELPDGGEVGRQAPVGALDALVLEEGLPCQDIPVNNGLQVVSVVSLDNHDPSNICHGNNSITFMHDKYEMMLDCE